MAVYSGSVNVNSGAVNWTRAQVLQSLELVFNDLGWHGAGESGILTGLNSPTNGWNQTGGTITPTTSGFLYYLYEAPTSGGRRGGAFQIIRYGTGNGSNTGKVYQVNLVGRHGTGWTSNQAFTIPGTATGGTSPANDIVFATQTTTIPSIVANSATYGSISSWFDSDLTTDANNRWAILKCVNDAAKTYGTTYYGFNITSDNNMYITSGSSYNPASDVYMGYGGIDVPSDNSDLLDNSGTPITSSVYKYYNRIYYASTVSPTQYPLTIRYWRANSPQDTNFCVISFVQSINGNTRTMGSFILHRGTNHGAGIWDLNHVYQGGFTSITGLSGGQVNSNTDGICIINHVGYGTQNVTGEAPPSAAYSVARESLYGYMRGNGSGILSDEYDTNIRTNNSYTLPALYYRNSSVDSITQDGITIGVSSSADYYKVLKGIPISNQMVPCPYYMPDDYVLIQFDTTPGLAEFYSGDTVTITAGSEVYTVIDAGYLQNQSSSTRTRGVMFCARTT